ncbi:MAG: hypothetical protein J6W03_07340 [Bacteroidaceae bacterium]|nr:hypothetical protein [Bacteroidaceae bacterium]
MRRKLLLIASSILLLAACESYDCTLYNHVGCYGAFDREGVAVQISDTLTITAGKNGPTLLNRSVGTASLNLPLSYWQDEDTLVFTIKGEDYLIQDTVWITKTNQVHYESPDCPTTLFHEIQNVRSTHTFIKSITVIRSSVNYELTTNLQIHLLSASN